MHCPTCNSKREGETCWKCGTATIVPCDGWDYPELPPVDRIREQDFQTENNAYRSQVNALCPTNDEPTPRELLEALVIDREANHARITKLETRLRDIGDIAHAQSTGPAEPDWLWQIRELAYELL